MAGEPITGRSGVSPLTGDREFESISLQRRVACEPEFSDLEGQADLAIAFSLTMVLFTSLTVLLLRGVGIWGIDVPVMWGFAIAGMSLEFSKGADKLVKRLVTIRTAQIVVCPF